MFIHFYILRYLISFCRDLQSKDTEWVRRNDKIWEFGFYEPPLEKMPKGKLMFREAIEAN